MSARIEAASRANQSSSSDVDGASIYEGSIKVEKGAWAKVDVEAIVSSDARTTNPRIIGK